MRNLPWMHSCSRDELSLRCRMASNVLQTLELRSAREMHQCSRWSVHRFMFKRSSDTGDLSRRRSTCLMEWSLGQHSRRFCESSAKRKGSKLDLTSILMFSRLGQRETSSSNSELLFHSQLRASSVMLTGYKSILSLYSSVSDLNGKGRNLLSLRCCNLVR